MYITPLTCTNKKAGIPKKHHWAHEEPKSRGPSLSDDDSQAPFRTSLAERFVRRNAAICWKNQPKNTSLESNLKEKTLQYTSKNILPNTGVLHSYLFGDFVWIQLSWLAFKASLRQAEGLPTFQQPSTIRSESPGLPRSHGVGLGTQDLREVEGFKNWIYRIYPLLWHGLGHLFLVSMWDFRGVHLTYCTLSPKPYPIR